MKVILSRDVEKLGAAGDTIEVKSGYGRNYLIPRNLAVPATKANLNAIATIRSQQELRDKKSRRDAEIVKERIEKLSVSVEVLVGEEDKLFGSVTNADVAALMSAEGVVVDKRSIRIDPPIKALGMYTVPVQIAKDVIAEVKVLVVKKS